MMMLECGQRYADRPAVWVDGAQHDYADLLANAQRIAAPLSRHRVERCAVFSTRTIWAYAGVLGALTAGAIYVPLNLHHPVERLLHVLEASDVEAIILDQRSLEVGTQLLARMSRKLIVIWLAQEPTPLASHLYVKTLPKDQVITRHQDGAYLLFTSGSTGAPKGVQVSHTNVLSYLSVARDRYGLTPEDRCTQLFDMTFDLSVHDMFVTWQAGACLYVPPATACMAPGNFLKRHNLTCWFSVLTMESVLR
jgi:non-ribosomal peptide synthetase component F